MKKEFSITVSKLLQKLNAALQVMVNAKTKASDFHDQVRAILDKEMAGVEMQYVTWDVKMIGSQFNGDYVFDAIFTLAHERKDDLRAQNQASWKTISIELAPVIAVDGETTIENYIKLIMLKAVDSRISECKKSIEEARKSISEQESGIAELEKESSKLQKELGLSPKTKKLCDLKEGEKFRFQYDGEKVVRTAQQVGKTEIYCPKDTDDTIGHSMGGGEEVYGKSETEVIML